jgi:hypothetical protein
MGDAERDRQSTFTSLASGMAPVRLALTTLSTVTTDALPAGRYKVGLTIAGSGLCYTQIGANPSAVVPTDKASAVVGAGPQLDAGDVLRLDASAKVSAILSGTNTTGELALTPLES